MITVLLEKIITILEGWIQSFTSHAQHVEDKLDSLDQTASDIKTNTDPISDIADNTGAVVTPVQNIKSNTDSIKQSSQTSANNTTAILNNISTLSTNTGRAAAYAQDCANNTLDILDKVTTIASDTTQIRANTAAIEDIKDLMQYYFINTIVTEDSEGVIANFDTDLEDYLQKAVVTIPADPTGYTGITLTKCGKNLNPYNEYNSLIPAPLWGTNFVFLERLLKTLPAGVYTLRNKYKIISLPDNNTVQYGTPYVRALIGENYVALNSYSVLTDNSPAVGKIYERTTVITITPEAVGNIAHVYLYCDSSDHSSANRGTYIAYDFQLEEGNVATEYEAYKAVTYPVSFGSTITDGAEADLLSGLVKVNTTPVSFIQIQPIAVRTYEGINNIYSDIGTSDLTYRETLKHYLDKNNQ